MAGSLQGSNYLCTITKSVKNNLKNPSVEQSGFFPVALSQKIIHRVDVSRSHVNKGMLVWNHSLFQVALFPGLKIAEFKREWFVCETKQWKAKRLQKIFLCFPGQIVSAIGINPLVLFARWYFAGTFFPGLKVELKEYYEIVGESRPLSAFFPTHADFVYRNAFLLMKISNPPSF